MKPLDLNRVREYVNVHIVDFHDRKIKSLEELKLNKLLTKNPYLFKAKGIHTPGPLITGLLDAFLSSSEEKLFGDFLEGLALFVAGQTCDAHKSTAQGVDMEFLYQGVHYIVSIKSGPNWGNSSQQRKLAEDLQKATMRLQQARSGNRIQPVLGICYGKTRTSHLRGYLKITGQNFWHLISENKDLYTDIIEPIGYQASKHNDYFEQGKGRVISVLTQEFFTRFCDADMNIDWPKLVQFTSGNLDLDQFPS